MIPAAHFRSTPLNTIHRLSALKRYFIKFTGSGGSGGSSGSSGGSGSGDRSSVRSSGPRWHTNHMPALNDILACCVLLRWSSSPAHSSRLGRAVTAASWLVCSPP